MQPVLKKIFISAGESSGDQHAASLVKVYKKLFGDAEFSALGGKYLSTEGVKIIFDYSRINHIGFTSVITNYFSIRDKFRYILNYIKQTNPDSIVLIDFPGFNLRLAKSVRKFYKGKIIYYISPQLWAWHKARVKTVKKFCDAMLVVFPFEVDFYKYQGVDAVYVGNPVANKIDRFLSVNFPKKATEPSIVLLPGSRKEEIKKILPVFLEAAKMLGDKFGLKIKVIYPSHLSIDDINTGIKTEEIEMIENKNDDVFYSTILDSELVFTKSGTSSMECVLLGVPFSTGYKSGKLNYLIGKRLIKVEYLTMANILLGRKLVNEFIQDELTAENLYAEGVKILTDDGYRKSMIEGFKEVRSLLTDDDASLNAARIIHDSVC